MSLYAQDSFFTLSLSGRVGLLVLSAVLALAMIALAYQAGRRLPVPMLLGPMVALVLFWLFLWLSPQIYYSYYRMIIPGLPQQWVIHPPMGIAELAALLSFQDRATLAQHGQAVLAWIMMASGLWREVSRYLSGLRRPR